jgi:hypothetical protein
LGYLDCAHSAITSKIKGNPRRNIPIRALEEIIESVLIHHKWKWQKHLVSDDKATVIILAK